MGRKNEEREKRARFLKARKVLQGGKQAEAAPEGDVPRCGLCGSTKNLTRTECCGNWICDDEHKYRLFSFAHNSCMRNHMRYTLCGIHYAEGHAGDWRTCKECREELETEMYVWYGTNEHNFEKLRNPPRYKPTYCSGCGRVIRLAEGGYSYGAEGYRCMECYEREHGKVPWMGS